MNHVSGRENRRHRLDGPLPVIVGDAIDSLASQEFVALGAVAVVIQRQVHGHRVGVEYLDAVQDVVAAGLQVAVVIREPFRVFGHVHRCWRVGHEFVWAADHNRLGPFKRAERKVQHLGHAF